MEFTYNRIADRVLVWLAKEKVAETKEIGPGVYADYDAEGRVIAVEALKASERYDLSGVEGAVPLEVKPPDVPKIAEMTPAERKAQAEELVAAIKGLSRDMSPRAPSEENHSPDKRKGLEDKFAEKVKKNSRDMGTRTWTRDGLYDRPKRYYQ